MVDNMVICEGASRIAADTYKTSKSTIYFWLRKEILEATKKSKKEKTCQATNKIL